jgi:hypothetical protein
MEITINLLEVAAELAHELVRAKFDDDDNALYVLSYGAITYTEDAQDLFNEWYDHYYDLIFNLKV